MRELLTHQAGLRRVRGLAPGPSALFDHDSVVGALASAAPDRR
ncbi:CubicO group peptidase (beta-lactamase class C family) [Rhodococcus opacus]|nr:CubicO group peptidase (beta-lactamase class C family) [Rhodococcus opacus]